MNLPKETIIAWIHCNYYENRLQMCLKHAELFLKSVNANSSSPLLCVNNGDTQITYTEHTKWKFLNGSNSVREFSAWQEGYDFISKNKIEYDILIISNDTYIYHQPYYLYMPLISTSVRRILKSKIEGWSLGVVERNNNIESIPKYLSSFFIVFDKIASEIIMPSINMALPQWCTSKDYTTGKIFISDDKAYEKKMNCWLLNSSVNSWYAAEPLSLASYSRISMKARCIILEHSLSKRVLDADIKMISCFDSPYSYCFKILYRLYFLTIKLYGASKRFLHRIIFNN